MSATNGQVERDVRAYIAQALARGEKRPGRDTLIEGTGHGEHDVRKVLDAMKAAGEIESPARKSPAPGRRPQGASRRGPKVSSRRLPGVSSQIPGELSNRSPGEVSNESPGEYLESPPGGHPESTPGEPLGTSIGEVPKGAGEPTSTGVLVGSGECTSTDVLVDSEDLETPELETSREVSRTAKRHRPWPLLVIGLGAAVAVWSGWVGLGRMSGFGLIQPLPGIWDDLRINTAVVLPLSVEAYAAYALRCWLGTTQYTPRTTRFAGWSAVISLIVGFGAQATYHLLEAAGYSSAPWPIVVLVSGVPVAVLGLASALAKMVSSDSAGGAE